MKWVEQTISLPFQIKTRSHLFNRADFDWSFKPTPLSCLHPLENQNLYSLTQIASQSRAIGLNADDACLFAPLCFWNIQEIAALSTES